jgi:hypothetical protein
MGFLASFIVSGRNDSTVNEYLLFHAAMDLVNLGKDGAATILFEIASNPDLAYLVRIDAAIELAEMNDARAFPLLGTFAVHPAIDQELRERVTCWLSDS